MMYKGNFLNVKVVAPLCNKTADDLKRLKTVRNASGKKEKPKRL